MIKVSVEINEDGKMFIDFPVVLKDPVVRQYLIDEGWSPPEPDYCKKASDEVE